MLLEHSHATHLGIVCGCFALQLWSEIIVMETLKYLVSSPLYRKSLLTPGLDYVFVSACQNCVTW